MKIHPQLLELCCLQTTSTENITQKVTRTQEGEGNSCNHLIGYSTLVLFYFDNPVTSFVFLGLIGISNGLANVLGSSTWAEIYGVKFIGSIKALTTALMVFSTAFGTALFGFLIDRGFSIEQIALISFIYIFISLFLLFFVRNKLNPQYI